MSSARNKKGIVWSTLIEILLVVVSTVLIINLIAAGSTKADEKASENLCKGFNALKFGVSETPVIRSAAPRACKTIDKGDLPGQHYKSHTGGYKEGAKAEIRDMMSRCWWMWLEGNQQNVFESKWYNLKNGCFICYTFSLDKSVKPFSYTELAASLNTPYYAVDDTDRCAPLGEGGRCMPLCDTSSDYFSKEVASDRCEQGLKCCIASDTRDACKNKGGRCLTEPGSEYTMLYDKWQCTSGNCYIKPEKTASYLDYIQGTGGASGGAGKVLFLDNANFIQGPKYAITFISPGKEWNINTLLGIGTTAALGAAGIVGFFSGVGTVPSLALLGSASGAAYLTGNTGEINDINMISISKYDTVSGKCAVTAGVGEKS